MEVTGSGTENPEGITADKFYTPTDPGIKVNVYSGDLSNYKMPGPALFSGASSGSGSGSSNSSTTAPTSSAAPSSSATSVAAQNNAASATPSASAAPSATGSAGSLPETFTIETFISWLEKAAGSSSEKARRHARAFRG